MNDGQQHVLEALPTYTNYKFNWKAKSILLNILISLQCLRDMNRDHKDLSGGKSVFFLSQTILHTISFLVLFFFFVQNSMCCLVLNQRCPCNPISHKSNWLCRDYVVFRTFYELLINVNFVLIFRTQHRLSLANDWTWCRFSYSLFSIFG